MTETTPDSADVHTGTDRVELTAADIEQLADELCRWHEDPDEVGDYTAPCDACRVQARCIAPFVVARMQALRDERDRLRLAVEDQATRKNIARRSESDIEAKYLAAVGDRDAARAELAAANARIAELEAIAERNGVRWCACSRAARRRDEANPACPLHGEPMVQQRNALQETLDRVTAVLASVEAINDGGWQPMVENILTKIGTDLRAALTPEGKPQ